MTTNIEDLQRKFADLVLAAGEVFQAWLDSLPADDRAIIVGEVEDGALPGLRLVLGDERRNAELSILLRVRSGDVETVGALALTRA